MNKLKKLVVLAVVIVGVILFIYPKPFKQTYKDVQVYENGNKVSKIDIELDGKIHKGRFVWQRLKFSEELHGSITIGDKKYSLSPVDLYEFPDEDGNYTDNGIYESLLSIDQYDIVNDNYLTFYITHDKSKLYINSNSKEFIYPSNTNEDYQSVKDWIY
ncbi:MAG: hypothetical protein V8T82_05720 [Romboutsia timonensis]|uniref:hypothetical protein n=1 Tax=Romboutsia ilealis TaxID=1115758 RepID=UPI00289DD21A|nr:hypothetical protein [Romboutsia ilealis]